MHRFAERDGNLFETADTYSVTHYADIVSHVSFSFSVFFLTKLLCLEQWAVVFEDFPKLR